MAIVRPFFGSLPEEDSRNAVLVDTYGWDAEDFSFAEMASTVQQHFPFSVRSIRPAPSLAHGAGSSERNNSLDNRIDSSHRKITRASSTLSATGPSLSGASSSSSVSGSTSSYLTNASCPSNVTAESSVIRLRPRGRQLSRFVPRYLDYREAGFSGRIRRDSLYGLFRLLRWRLLQENNFRVEPLDKIFCSEWLNSRQIVFGTKCNRLMILDTRTHQLLEIENLRSSRATHQAAQQSVELCGIHGMAVNPSRTRLVTGAANPNDTAVFELPSFDPICVGEAGHTDWIFDVKWLDDEHYVSGGRDTRIALWHVSDLSSSTSSLSSFLSAPTLTTHQSDPDESTDCAGAGDTLTNLRRDSTHTSAVSSHAVAAGHRLGARFQANQACTIPGGSGEPAERNGFVRGLRNETPLPVYFHMNAKVCVSSKFNLVRALAVDNRRRSLLSLALSAYVQLWDTERFVMLRERALDHVFENVCIAAHDRLGVSAIGSKSYVTLIDNSRLAPLRHIHALRNTCGVRSVSFFGDHLLTIGTGQSNVLFIDVRTYRYLETEPPFRQRRSLLSSMASTTNDSGSVVVTGNSSQPSFAGLAALANKAYLQCSPGWIESTEYNFTNDYNPAVYTHCYDPSGLKLFTAGGPLPASLRGSYAALWE